MKKLVLKLLFVGFFSVFHFSVLAQVGIGVADPNPKAVLELHSPGNNQGFLVPRLTSTQRNAMDLSVADKGMLVFDTNDNKFYYWSGAAWIVIEDSVGTGTVTSITTGGGLAGGPITVTGEISIADNGVTTAKLADNAVTTTKIADGAVTAAKLATTGVAANSYGSATQVPRLTVDAQGRITGVTLTTITGTLPGGAAGGDLTGTYPNPTIAANAIGSAEITDGSITSADIADGTIAAADLASNSVTMAKIADGAVIDAKISNVAPSKITAGGATAGQVLKWNGTNWAPQTDDTGAAQTLTYTPATGVLEISGGNNVTITGTAPGGAAGGDLTGTYPNPTLGTGVVTSAKIQDGTIVTADLADNSVTAAKVVDGTLTNNDISTSAAIAVAKMAPGTNGQVLTTVAGVTAWAAAPTATGAAGGDLTGTYPNPTLGTGVVTSAKIQDGTIVTADLSDNSVTSAKIANGTIVTADLADDAVTSAKIANGTIVTADLADGSVTAQKLANTTVTPGTYGTSTIVPRITVDAQGRITGVTNQTISTGGSQNLSSVLAAGNSAENQSAVNFGSIAIGTEKAMAHLHVAGSQIVNQLVVQDNYMVKHSDYSIFVPNTGKNVTIQLPPIEGDPDYAGRVIIIRSMNPQTVRVMADVPSKDFIDFYGTEYDMAQYGNSDHINRFHTFTLIATKLSGNNRWIVVNGLKGSL